MALQGNKNVFSFRVIETMRSVFRPGFLVNPGIVGKLVARMIGLYLLYFFFFKKKKKKTNHRGLIKEHVIYLSQLLVFFRII